MEYFNTVKSRILHISDLLEDKAYDLVKKGLQIMHENPSDTSKWMWHTHEAMIIHLSRYYETVDKTQVAKNKLDNSLKKTATTGPGSRNSMS